MQRVIGVLSGKGGVGKTVTAINLSAALHEAGHDTTIVDADTSSANLAVHLGLPDASTSLQDVLEGREPLYKAIRTIPNGLKIVPSSLSMEKSIVELDGFANILKEGLSDFVIVDSPPGFDKRVYHIIDACDEVVVVTNPDVPSITDAVKMIEISKRMGKDNVGVVLTRIENTSFEVSPWEIENLCEVPIIGRIPEDRHVKRAIFGREPLVFHSPYSKAALEYRRLAANVTGSEYNPPRLSALRRIFGA